MVEEQEDSMEPGQESEENVVGADGRDEDEDRRRLNKPILARHWSIEIMVTAQSTRTYSQLYIVTGRVSLGGSQGACWMHNLLTSASLL